MKKMTYAMALLLQNPPPGFRNKAFNIPDLSKPREMGLTGSGQGSLKITDNEAGNLSDYNRPNIIKSHAAFADEFYLQSWLPVEHENLTRQTETLNALKISIERYEYVTKATNEAIWDWDLKTGDTYWGDGFRRLFGFKAENGKASFRAWIRRIHPGDQKRVLAKLKSVKKNKEEFWSECFRFKKESGRYAIVVDKGVSVFNKKLEVVRMIGAIQDVTEVVKYRRAIERQNEQLREISWIQSHVIRAPLARIMGLINLLQNCPEAEFRASDALKYLERSAEELDAVINEIVGKTVKAKRRNNREMYWKEHFGCDSF